MRLPEEVNDEVLKRLRRVEGQVGGVIRMLEEGKDCKDVLIQLSAASKALERAGLRLVVSGLTYCIENPDSASSSGDTIDSLEKLFVKLS